jgi:hypothetical protein
LSLVACGLALASATCASVFSETSAKKTSDWRRSVGLLVPVAMSVAILPTLLSVVDGRWHQPEATVSQLFAQMPDNPADGNYRTLFVGDNELLPISTNAVTNKVSYGVSDDGPVNIVSHWAPQRTAMNALADQALTALVNRQTVRIGRLMSPLAIRYIVVPLGDQPSQSSRLLIDSLSNQITYGGLKRIGRHPHRLQTINAQEKYELADTFCGNIVLIPGRINLSLSGIDGEYEHGYADYDFGYRAKKMGFDIQIIPGFLGTCSANPPLLGSWNFFNALKTLTSRKYLPIRSQIRFCKRHGGVEWPIYVIAPYLRAILKRKPYKSNRINAGF